jgi:hypothetical protein
MRPQLNCLNRLVVSLAFLLTVTAPIPASAADVELVCSKGFDALLAQVRSQPETKPLQQSEQYVAYELGLNTYTITTPKNPAHPSIVRRQIVEDNKGISVRMTSCGYGDKAAFNAMMKEFEQLNESMKQQIKRDHPTPPSGQ